MMKLLATLAHLVIYSSAGIIRSSTRVYRSCQEVGEKGNARVYAAAYSGLYEGQPECNTGENVILKCPISGQEPLIEREFKVLERLQGLNWAPSLLDFADDPESPLKKCIVLEKLAMSLQNIRDGYAPGDKLHWVTLGSIGARSIEIMTSFHRDLGLIHTDPHPGNWMLEPTSDGSLSPHMKMIDFGDCTSFWDPFPPNQVRHRWEDIQQIVMSLRYLYDGDFSFYAYKRLEDHTRPLVCQNVPKTYCDVFQYIDSPSETGLVDYDLVRNYMLQLVTEHGGQYNGEIIWNPTVSTIGTPKINNLGRPASNAPNQSGSSLSSPDKPTTDNSQLSSASKLPVLAGSKASAQVTVWSALGLLLLFLGVF